jgi:protoporphyrinogen oxidase
MARKIVSAIPGLKPPGSGRFFYPRRGYGQISEAYASAASAAGATICTGVQVSRVEVRADEAAEVSYTAQGDRRTLRADHVWSTVPITVLARLLDPGPPAELLDAASQLDFRAMILVYLVVEQDQFTEYDAHYFPEQHIPITRLTEPKNYANLREPHGLTVLCAELPCSPSDPIWRLSDAELGQLVADGIAAAGIPLQARVQQVITRRLPHAYPIYHRGYEHHFERLDGWLASVDRILSFGRQGLFAHDNTHHALYMAYCAADCLDSAGTFDHSRWKDYRQIFETHVVED